MALSSLVLDHYDMLDAGQITKEDVQKVADSMGGRIMSQDDRNRQKDTDFGLILIASSGDRHRRFLLGTAFDAFMSKTAAMMNSLLLPAGARNVLNDRVTAACGRFNNPIHHSLMKKSSSTVPSPFYLLSSADEADIKMGLMQKSASPDEFAITTSINGTKMASYPIGSPSQVESRIRDFERIHSRIHVKYAFQYAENVLARAKTLGVAVPANSKLRLYKQAALNPGFNYFVDSRVKMAPESLQPAYVDLMLKKASSDPRQLAVALDSLDRSCGMDTYWGREFPTPAETTFTLQKRAETISVGDTSIDTQDLLDAIEAHPDQYSQILDPDTLAALIANPKQVLESLPAPHKQALVEAFSRQST